MLVHGDRAFKRVLQGNLPSILLAQKTANHRLGLLPREVSGDLVGDGEQNERVELDVEPGVR